MTLIKALAAPARKNRGSIRDDQGLSEITRGLCVTYHVPIHVITRQGPIDDLKSGLREVRFGLSSPISPGT